MTTLRARIAILLGRLVGAKPMTARPSTEPASRVDAAVPTAVHRHVAVVLSAHCAPRLHDLSAAQVAAPTLELAGQRFVDSGAGDWLGFYDWLRDGAGTIVGIHQWIDDWSRFPFSKTFAGVDAHAREGWVRILFDESRDVDEGTSCSQDFGDNRLLVSTDAIALTFLAADDLRESGSP